MAEGFWDNAPTWLPGGHVAQGGDPNAWQNSPEYQQKSAQYAWRYYQNNPTAQRAQQYSDTAQGYSANQIMHGQGPNAQAPGLAGGSQLDGSALWAMLSGQNGPANSQLDLQNQLLLKQQGMNTQMTGLKQSDLRTSATAALGKNALQSQNAANQLGHDKKGEGFVNQLYGEANKAAGLDYARQRDALLSDATSRGAVNAHGTVGQFKNQYEGFANQLAQNTTQRDRSLSDLHLSEQNAQNLAKSYGIDRNEITQHLNNGLQQLGLRGQMDANDILAAISSNDYKKAGLAQDLVNSFIGFAQGNPALLNYLNNVGGGGSSKAPKQVSIGGGRKVY